MNNSNEPTTKKQRQGDRSPKPSTTATKTDSSSSASNITNSSSESLAQLAQSVIDEMDMKRKNDEAMISGKL